MEWTDRMPEEVGYFWFYGYTNFTFQTKNNMIPEMMLVKIRKISNGWGYVANGQFLYRTECFGLWLPAELPSPPDLKPLGIDNDS